MSDKKLVHLSRFQAGLLKLADLGSWPYGKKTVAKPKVPPLTGRGIFGLSSILNEFHNFNSLPFDRRQRYVEYDSMDEVSPEIGRALNLYAQEVTAPDYHTEKVIWVTSPDSTQAKRLNNFLKRLDMQERSFGICRSMAKYGDEFNAHFFESIDGSRGAALLKSVKHVHPSLVDRLETDQLIGFDCQELQRILEPGNKDKIYRPWDWTHFRCMSYQGDPLYGDSYLLSVRRIWRLLQIMETMVAIAHVQRAIDRHIFNIDIGDLSEEEGLALVKQYKNWLRRVEYFDPETGQFRSDFNPTTIQQDLFWPKRKDDASGVTTLEGKQVPQGLIDDVNYFRRALIAGLGIPPDFLDGTTSGAWDSKAALVLQDVHFARNTARLQRSFKRGVHWMCEVYLWASTGKQPAPFKIHMGSLSLVADLMNEDRWLKRSEVVGNLSGLADQMGWNKPTWSKYITKEILRDIPPEILKALTSSVHPGSFDQGGGEDDEKGKGGEKDDKDKKKLGTTRSPYLTNPKPDSITSKLLSSMGDEERGQLSISEDAMGNLDIANLKSRFRSLKRSVVEAYPELEPLAEKIATDKLLDADDEDLG